MRAFNSCVLAIVSLFCIVPCEAADTLIFNNSVSTAYVYPEYPASYTQMLDYGTTTGGLISKFAFRYSSTSSGTVWVRFYRYTNSSYEGSLVQGFAISLPSTGGALSTREYVIAEQDRFELYNGYFGYSFEFSNSTSRLALATGGTGIDRYFWEYDDFYNELMLFYFPSAYNFYFKVYKAPPIDEVTCDIKGAKFNDADGDGTWDAGELAMTGWEFYIDANNDGVWQTTEPNVVTDPNGHYMFENMPSPATYRVREILKNGWTQTLPGSSGNYEYLIVTEPNNVYEPYNFGNTTLSMKYGGGDGTETNPYLISAPAHLQQLGSTPADWVDGKFFSITADLNMSAYTGTSFKIIGTSTTSPFNGYIEGNNHTISNFTYSTTSSTSYIGLFGCFNGRLTNIKMTNVYVYAPNANYVGGICGHLGAWILGCGVQSGSVRGYNYVGGLAGNIDFVVGRIPAIYQSYSKCTVIANQYAGGIAGNTRGGTIRECYSNSPVTASYYVGGIFGNVQTTTLYLEKCYATGLLTGLNRGGLVGQGSAASIRSFWDRQTTNCTVSGGGESKSTAEMKSASTFIGWGCSGVWMINAGVDYPRLTSENIPGTSLSIPVYGGGSGTQADPYLIYTAQQFNDVGAYECHSAAFFRLMADIELDPALPTNFVPVGQFKGFTGYFDGNNHVIFDPHYVQTDANRDFVGLFTQVGVLGTSGTIENLGIVGPEITSAGEAVGGLAGYVVRGAIRNSFVRGGHIQGAEYVGGLAGGVDLSTSIVQDCAANTSVAASGGAVGGLLGSCFSAAVDRCYAAGAVSGLTDAGGLIGYCSSPLISNSFYDSQTTGQAGQGTPKTTAQMRTQSTFTGWDFASKWRICDGMNYPRLQWEPLPVGDFTCPEGVEVADVVVMADSWLRTGVLESDIAPSTPDGKADLKDFAALAGHWLEGTD